MSSPGILYVTMQPKPGLSQDQFDEWYNNEHGPTRLRIPSIFENGFRYRAIDGEEPGFMAVYDVTSMPLLETPTYTTLRANRSPREAATIGQVDVKRSFFDLLHTKESPLFMPIEKLSDDEAAGLVTVAVEMSLKDEPGAGEQYQSWYIEEHVELLAKVPGWLRSRLFKTSSLEDAGKSIYFCLHDYAKENGLGGPEHKASMDTPRRTAVFDKFVGAKGRRTFELFYAFGPASTDLSSLSRLPATAAFTSADKLTTTTPGADAAISSYIETTDGLRIPYRLEGNPSPAAPTVAFCNSLLTSYAMWDPLIEILKKQRPDLRILRYDTRGRHAIPQPAKAATLITVTDDLLLVLRALRIEKLHALIGVSMGGATTLNFALTYPDRVGKFIAADFNCTSSAANTQAWKDRIDVAKADSGKGINTLAEQTVTRWFHPNTVTDKPDVASWMTQMVAANDVEGFANSCTALWEYDLKPIMPTCKVPGLLAVGDSDGKGAVVKAMEGFKGLVGTNGVELKIVPNTGHLPMCEDPDSFWTAIKDFV
ncbi:hypothetical protein K4F52_004639 [Lecanicillium sp. MT-2017a]|nr:hypothetical protein K4F52_004639 [Lecanicillium sp. MT-2017a]